MWTNEFWATRLVTFYSRYDILVHPYHLPTMRSETTREKFRKLVWMSRPEGGPPPSSKSESTFHKQHYNTTTAEARTGGRDMNGREIQVPSKYAKINGQS